MPIDSIILLCTLLPAVLGSIVFTCFLEWKRNREFEMTLSAVRDNSDSIADSMDAIALNFALYNSRHEPPKDGFLK